MQLISTVDKAPPFCRGFRRFLTAVPALALCLALCLSLASCGPYSGEEGPCFRLGVIADLSEQGEAGNAEKLPSDLAFYYGVQYAVNETVVSCGGGEGEELQFRMLTGDLAGDTDNVWEVYNSLVQQGADAIVCPARYAGIIEGAAEEAGIPLMVPDGSGSAAGENAPKEQGSFFTLQPAPAYYGRAAAFLMSLSSYRTAAILVDREDAYFRAAAESFRSAAAEYGISVSTEEQFSSGDADSLEAAVQKLADSGNIDGIFVGVEFTKVMESVGAALLQNGLYQSNFILCTGGSDYTEYLDGDLSGIRWLWQRSQCLGACLYNKKIKKIPKSEFAVRFEELYGSKVERDAVLSYMGASLLLRAAKTAGEGETLSDCLRGMSFKGITGVDFVMTPEGYAEGGFTAVKFAYDDEGQLIDKINYENYRPRE